MMSSAITIRRERMVANIVRSESQAWGPRLDAGPAAASTARARD